MRESTGGTRDRIKAVALELFTEQGYEKTSLREIAERLNVTKAALYYHFKSKDDIVASFVEDRLEQMDALNAWAATQPATLATRRELITRYADTMFGGDQPSVMRFFEQNQTVLKSLASGQQMRGRMMQLASALCRGDDSPAAQLRAALSLFAVHTSWFAVRAPGITNEERRRLALEVADELLGAIGAGASAEPDESAAEATSGSPRG
ncbi:MULTISPECIES: TetR/AcrR family transcriptional regulator [Micromonospora]|uniref:TetR/AcrR family transcriptional regulator n=1 Tax=Micromonospora zamorensis TaxID=709883 RepID=A0ABZ1PEN5_9ACTN|nr:MULTISPECIES: TetR/AcrR family transcriptional regulator [Micromonospora]MBQ0978883.1 TetR/AcrR family transcriptional regulator [Micromonospora sp. M61]MBQ1039701.1 TetR/AcrR family transcriptional regulator [Micromonospora sp. C81]TQJ24909.1 TetR family transcriptional regulator [Micromonospora sp. A202]WTI21265.1 TetR/AcrR family transcriptional regulator [Micromonospora zamorensis]SCG63233.1 transcriptional regulator, TetR family [Micromonospora zamorensis]